jgi:hypothetical protein
MNIIESQRDSVIQPKVARNELPWVVWQLGSNPEGVVSHRDNNLKPVATTPLGLKNILFCFPKVGARRANLGLKAAIPLGLLKLAIA